MGSRLFCSPAWVGSFNDWRKAGTSSPVSEADVGHSQSLPEHSTEVTKQIIQ